MKNIFKSLFITASIILISSSVIKADSFELDLSSNITFPTSPIEVEQNYETNIIIKNETTGDTNIDASEIGITLSYIVPEGSSLESAPSDSTSWKCSQFLDNGVLNCQYYGSLNNGKKTNTLIVTLKAPSSPGSLTGVAKVTSAQVNTENDTSSASILFGKSNISASKSVSSTTVGTDEEFIYTITVNNNAHATNPTVATRDLTITDNLLPLGIEIQKVSDTDWCSYTSDKLTCIGQELDVNTSRSVNVTVKATSGGTKINTANISVSSADYNSPIAPTASVKVNLADIVLTKTLIGGINETSAAVDSTVTYNISVKNIGETAAKNVRFTDTLPSEVIYQNISKGIWNCTKSGLNVTCDINGTLLNNEESYDVNITVKMPSDSQSIVNTAKSLTDTLEENATPNNNDDSLTTDVKGANLEISIEPATGEAFIGTDYTYKITVKNHGFATAKNVYVTDTIDSNIDSFSNDASCSINQKVLTCNPIGSSIAAGDEWSFNVTTTMPIDMTGPVYNDANVTTTTSQESTPSYNKSTRATTTVIGPVLNIKKDANVTEIGLGKPFTYTITVTNTNEANATNLVLNDVFSSNPKVTITSITSPWSCNNTPTTHIGNFECNLSALNGTAPSILTINALAPTDLTTKIKNTATVSSTLAAENSDSVNVSVEGVILTPTKTASATAVVGGEIDYNITIVNSSLSDAPGVTITDDLLDSLRTGYTLKALPTSVDDWSCSQNVNKTFFTCTKDEVLAAKGGTSTINFKVNVPQDSTLVDRKNKASVISSAVGSTSTDFSSNATQIKGSHLIVTKTGDTKGTANEQIEFAIEVANNGSAVANDVNLTIDLNKNNASNSFGTADFTDVVIDCGVGGTFTAPNICKWDEIDALTGSKTVTINATSPNYDSTYSNENINNTASAVTSTPQENSDNDEVTWSVSVEGANLKVTKTPSSNQVAVGETVTYTITLENDGYAIAQNIHLDDTVLNQGVAEPLILSNLQAGTGWTCTPSASPTFSSFSCDYNSTLSKDDNTTNIEVNATAPMGATLDADIFNDVNVSTTTAETVYGNTNNRSSGVLVKGADVTITKTVDKNTTALGEEVTFTIEVSNIDVAEAKDVNVTDILPDGFTNISSSCDNKTISGQSVICQLENGDAVNTFTITATAPNETGTFTNTATVVTSTPESNDENNEDNATVTVEGADLDINKYDSADYVAVNSMFYYTISLQNVGTSTAHGADINDTVADYFRDISIETLDANWVCTLVDKKVHCTTSQDLNGTASGNAYNKSIVRINVRAPSYEGWVHNTAVVETDTPEQVNIINNNIDTESTLVISVNLQAQKRVNGITSGINTWNNRTATYTAIGDDISYTLHVRNVAISNTDGNISDTSLNIPITDINITDILPENITDITVTPSSSRFTCNETTSTTSASAGDTVTCKLVGDSLKVSEGWLPVATINAKATTTFYSNQDADMSYNAGYNYWQVSATNRDAAHNWIVNQYNAVTSQEVSSLTLYDNAPGGDGYLETHTLIRGANMSIDKSGPEEDIGANQSYTYNLAVKNYPLDKYFPFDSEDEHAIDPRLIPSTDAAGVQVIDTLPADVNFTSAISTDTNWDCKFDAGTHKITCDYTGTMSAEDTISNIVVTVEAPNLITPLTNTAKVTTTTPELDSKLYDNNDSITTDIIGTILNINKGGTPQAGMGDELAYDINITNSSSVPAKDLVVTDILDGRVTIEDGNWSRSINTTTWDCQKDDDNITCNYRLNDGTLDANTTETLRIYTIAPNETRTIVNAAKATSSTIGTNNVIDYFDTNITGANIDFANNPFVQSPSSVGAYYPIDYNITIENKGKSEAENINLTMQFEDGFSQEFNVTSKEATDPWSCDFNQTNVKLTCTLATLAKETTSMVQIHATAPNANKTVSYQLEVSAKDSEDNNTSSTLLKDNVTTVIGSDLRITKYANDPDLDTTYHDSNITMGVGKPINFKISVKNEKIGLAKDINVTDTILPGFSDFNITNDGGWTCNIENNTSLTCNLAELGAEATAPDIYLSATTPLNLNPTSNTADVNTTTAGVDSKPTDTVQIKLEGAVLTPYFSVSKEQVALGEDFTYDLNISNTGRNIAFDVNVIDIFDANFTDINTSGTDWNCTNVGNTFTCNQPEIAAYDGNSLLSFALKAPINTIGIFTNSADINSSSIETHMPVSAPSVRVVGADLNVSITSDITEALEDRNVTYTISVKDINISTAHDVNLTQIFNPAITALYITDNNCTNDANTTVRCSFGNLDYNQDKNITVIATMPKNMTEPISLKSTVSVTTSTPQENLVSHSADVDITVSPIIPKANYRFEECTWSGTNEEVIDSIGGLHGTAMNDAKTLNHYLAYDDNNFSTAWRVGSFDGSNDYVQAGDNFDDIFGTTSNQFTITTWIKPSELTNDETNHGTKNTFIAKASDDDNDNLEIGVNEDGSLNLYIDTKSKDKSATIGSGIATDIWHFIAIIYDNGKVTVAIDEHIYTDNSTWKNGGNIDQAVGSPFTISSSQHIDNYFTGNIDEVEIYNIALDERAVKEIYNFELNHKNYDGTTRDETICGVDLNVIKTSSAGAGTTVGADTPLSYTITVTNESSEPLLSGFTLTDILPNNVTENNVSWSSNMYGCTDVNNTTNIQCTFPTGLMMLKDESEEFTINITTPNLHNEDINNTAVVSISIDGNQTDYKTSNNTDSVVNTTRGTDLEVFKTATVDSNESNIVTYTITVKNKDYLTPATGITITDTYDSRLVLFDTTGSCSSGNPFTCTIPDLQPGGEYSIIAKMTSENGTSIENNVSVSSYTIDYKTDNNDDSVSVDVNITGSNLPVVLVDGFRKHVSSNNYGRMLTIGNTILEAKNNTGSLGLADTNTSYIHVDSQPLNSSSADLNISEENVYIEYAGLYWGGHKLGEDNNDTLDSGFNKVKFETPKNTHTVVAGTIKDSGSVNSTDDDITGFYRFKKNDTSKARLYYASEANVTSLLRDEYAINGTINGTFVVSGIDVSAGIDNTASLIPNSSSASGWSYYNSGFFGGWELVVIYSVDHKTYRGVKYKNSTIFDGFKALMPRQKDQEVSLEIAVDGFITPQTGTINSSLYSMVLAGDSTLAFESMSIENILNTKTFVQENNSADNIFNDTITLKNIDNSVITKDLNLSYNPGVDLDEFSIDSAQNDGTCSSGDDCYLSNEQTSTKIELKVKSDENETSPGSNQYAAQYAFVNMIGLSTQIFTPDFIDSYKECFKLQDPRDDEYNDVNASWIPCDSNETKLTRGSIIKYRITLLNSGTDDAINVKVTDELPEEVTFLGTASPENNITNTIFYDLTSYGSCNNDTYNSKEGNSTRATCRANIKNILTTDTVPLNSIPDGIDESLNLIDTSNTTHLSTTATTSTNTALTFEYPNFPRLNVAWIEFYTKINSKAKLGESFENSISIDFTNQTLLDAGVSNLQTQESDPIDSGAIVFNWEDIEVPIQDKNQNEERVGAKVVNAKFDLNVTLTRAEGFDSDANTTLVFLDSLNIIDIHNNRDEQIYSTVVDANVGIPLGDTNPTWFTNDTFYGHASKELWFDMNLSIKEGNYTESKNYKTFTGDYAGDVFTTRPASFNMTFSASNPVYTDSNGTKYYIVKAGDDDLGMAVNALDASGSDTVDYNTTLFENTSDITVEADTTRQIDPSFSCFNLNDFNISDIIFGGGFASVSDIKYDDVGFIELTLKDSNWTQIDQNQSIEQCNNVSGDNNSSDADGLINCDVDGNSTKYVIVFIPDHFEFISPSLNDQGSGFTYIVPNPIDDAMFGKITTKVVSKNSEGNTTEFFKNGCYADDVNIQLSYDIESENNTSSLSIGTANENDINGSKTINSSISDIGNLLETIAPEGNFSSGSADINLQIAVQGNRVDAMQPILLTAKNLKGTITHYRDVNSTDTNVADAGGTDINSSNTLHFIYGRVHAPDYRFPDASGNAKIYYESYCKDCNDTKRNSMGISNIESIDSINWYINENHTAADGSVSTYSTVDDATFGGSDTATSGTITNGIESITVNAPIKLGVDLLPYKDKVEMNSTEWITFDPKDFIIEFQDKADDWAGQGQLGHIIDTNVSKRSNRRLDW